MRYAKIELFMDMYIDPELFKLNDKPNKQKRYITMKEIAFVACMITTSALNNGYRTHLISYNTFMTKWRDAYKKCTDLSPTKHKLSRIIKILIKYKIIGQTKRRSKTPIYIIESNNPYHPDYKPVTIKDPVGHKTTNSQSKSTSKAKTPKQLQSEGDGFDKEIDNILKNRKDPK
jgi:hypothetical protein